MTAIFSGFSRRSPQKNITASSWRSRRSKKRSTNINPTDSRPERNAVTERQHYRRNAMPLFEFLCGDCGKTCEILVRSSDEPPSCPDCGSSRLKKLLSVPSAVSGVARHGIPGPGDTGCCGATPGHAGCAGPGSCCGRAGR
ncbi:MAG: zinc ribbon domain-containing protein [Desulfococcus multivorans]|nr:zinc ribbon domain-containing protein [Desulfococcus multivorans]